MVGSLRRLVAEMGGELRGGDADAPILGIVPPDEAQGGDLTLYVDGRYREDMSSTRAVAVVTDRAHAGAVVESGRVAWVVDDPGAAVARLVDLLCPDVPDLPPPLDPGTGLGVSASAIIGAGAALGPGCLVHDGAIVGEGSSLGSYSVVARGAVLGVGCVVGHGALVGPGTRAGDRVAIGPGAVVGSDGFGLRMEGGGLVPVRHVGRVVLGSDVSVGARSVIARGTLGTTRIGDGTRLDAQVHVGHNARIGRGCVLAAQVGIAGSARIGDSVMIGGQAGIADHVLVGDGARIAARSGVASNVPAGAEVEGYPAMERWRWLRVVAGLARMPDRGGTGGA